jgi:hypothetical protein
MLGTYLGEVQDLETAGLSKPITVILWHNLTEEFLSEPELSDFVFVQNRNV